MNSSAVAQWDADRVVEDVRRLGGRGLPLAELHRQIGARLRRALPFDAACWHGLDPDTLLLTTANPEELIANGFLNTDSEPRAAQAVLASEYLRPDVNAFAALARRRSPVGVLSQSTRGRPQHSARYREFLAKCGTPHELRAVFVTRQRAWGCVVIHRSERSGDFGDSDVRLMAELSGPIADALRQSVRLSAARGGDDPRAPGLVILGPRNEPELITATAEQLLEDLRSLSPATRQIMPIPVLTTAEAVRTARQSRTVHIASASGWISLHASLPDGGHSQRVAVVVQRAAPEQTASLRLEALGLTAREREIAELVARGHSTQQISERLFLSPWTVQDHLKAIFDKTGVRSRRQLLATIFFSEQLPSLLAGAPLDAHGHLRHLEN
ncbi:MAG: LuxR C-terminal-related transcriptional regulator [Jatrophihabitans sp.]|uniref:helix-turn-helix transcriptional regulator n=1 Tax=Jatrophihabitans sp. TaxID=1932789 RepID=UPI00391318EB